jgi:hypothetical protein
MAIHAPKESVEAAQNSEQQEYELLEEGLYLAKAVEAKEKPIGPSGYGGVSITWEVILPRASRGRKLWSNYSWSPRAAWKIKEFWDALGYEYDSDFEEPVEAEEQAILEVVQEPIGQGKNKGKLTNTVDQVLEANEKAIAALPA